jgi:hypothetical protein
MEGDYFIRVQHQKGTAEVQPAKGLEDEGPALEVGEVAEGHA